MAIKTPPNVAAQIVVLRTAGYTLPVIASKTDTSVSTVKRVLKRCPAPDDDQHLDLVEEARSTLREQYGSDDAIGALYATLMADTLYHIETSREVAHRALEKLNATDTKDAALTFRALTAHATALKTHIDTIRMLAPKPELIGELPELHVRSLTDEEVEELRANQEDYDRTCLDQ